VLRPPLWKEIMREYLFSRIVAGYLKFEGYEIHPIDRRQKLLAQELYQEIFDESLEAGMFTIESVLPVMDRFGIWTAANEQELKKIDNDIDDIKVAIFEHNFRETERKILKEKLRDAEQKAGALLIVKHSWDYLTAEGLAAMARTHFMLLAGLRIANGPPVWTDNSFLTKPFDRLGELLNYYQSSRLSESQVRDIAKNEPWRSLWNISQNIIDCFGKPSLDLSDEQVILAGWSSMYDSIYEASDPPRDDVIQDDDMLDGWLIVQRRKRQQELDIGDVENRVSNDKIQKANEIFIAADTLADAKKIYNANSVGAKIAVRQRFNKIETEGVVRDDQLPDVQQKLRIQIENLRKG